MKDKKTELLRSYRKRELQQLIRYNAQVNYSAAKAGTITGGLEDDDGDIMSWTSDELIAFDEDLIVLIRPSLSKANATRLLNKINKYIQNDKSIPE
jgi:hypothetical protein